MDGGYLWQKKKFMVGLTDPNDGADDINDTKIVKEGKYTFIIFRRVIER